MPHVQDVSSTMHYTYAPQSQMHVPQTTHFGATAENDATSGNGAITMSDPSQGSHDDIHGFSVSSWFQMGQISQDEVREKSSPSKETVQDKIGQDLEELFVIRDLDKAEEYFIALPADYCAQLVKKLLMRAIESKQADAQLVADLFERVHTKNLCSDETFEEGFMPAALMLDDIVIDAPMAFELMAIMMKGAKFDEERQSRIARKSTHSDRLLDAIKIIGIKKCINQDIAAYNRCMAKGDQVSPEVVGRQVRSLLCKLTMENFESVSDEIISWTNKSENETDGLTLVQITRLVFEKATDEATGGEVCAHLCQKMMEQISPNFRNEGIHDAEGKPIIGGFLFRKYFLNRCQEDFERRWVTKGSIAAAARTKVVKEAKGKAKENKEGDSKVSLYSDEYYTTLKAKRQGLGLVKFIGELFKLQVLTEGIMHGCIKKLLSNVDNPEEEVIEGLCKLLTTVGEALDTTEARHRIDAYFSRMRELSKSINVSLRMRSMLKVCRPFIIQRYNALTICRVCLTCASGNGILVNN